MPYVLKESRRLALLAMDIPNPSPELKDAVNDMLRLMRHPLAVANVTTTDVYGVENGKVTHETTRTAAVHANRSRVTV